MQELISYTGGNLLLDQLIAAGSSAIIATAVVMRVEAGNILLDSNKAIEYVYYPIDMTILVTTLMRDGSEVEVGSIGCEGMLGTQLILGVDHVPGKAICYIGGSAVRVPAQPFLQGLAQYAPTHRLILRYLQAMMNLHEISIACNALHAVEARCARWLLATQDRVQRNEFAMTQDFLAAMLGVRRATVNAAAQDLQERAAIRYTRGQVRILNREILERTSCECYQLSIDLYDELLDQAPFQSRSVSPDQFLNAT